MKSFVLALLFSSSAMGAQIKQVDLSPDAFAEASVQARDQADDQIKQSKRLVNYAENNEMWKKNFMASEFYKSYQQHLVQADQKEARKQQNLKTIAQMKGDYNTLAQNYNQLRQQAVKNQKEGQEMAKSIEGAKTLFQQKLDDSQLFATGAEGTEDLGQTI